MADDLTTIGATAVLASDRGATLVNSLLFDLFCREVDHGDAG